jgi:hypothetical protein
MSSQVPFGSLPGSNGPTATARRGDTIRRPAGPWTPAVHALLRHLEAVGFPASPRVVGDGYDDQGREVLAYIGGRIAHPHPYTDEGIWQVGPAPARPPRRHRRLPAAPRGALAAVEPRQPRARRGRRPLRRRPWHVIVREGRPVGLVDWSTAGPTDRLEELAATGWWNTQLGFGAGLDPGSDSPDAATDRGTRLRSSLDG